MNTAICFAGTGRAIEHTFENLRKNVIDPFEHRDLIIYIVDSPKATEVKRCFEGLGNAYVHIVKEESLAIDKYTLVEGFRGTLSFRHGQGGPQIFFNMLKSRSYLNNLIDQHFKETQSQIAKTILENFRKEVQNFQQVCPKEMIDKLTNPLLLKTKVLKAI